MVIMMFSFLLVPLLVKPFVKIVISPILVLIVTNVLVFVRNVVAKAVVELPSSPSRALTVTIRFTCKSVTMLTEKL